SPGQKALPVTIAEHLAGGERDWTYRVSDCGTWTRYLLDPTHLDALDAAQALPLVRPLGQTVAFEVSIVTGANAYFTVDAATLAEYKLERWAVPLLPRTRHAPGLVYTETDRDAALIAGAKVWLLDFSATHPDPRKTAAPRRYIDLGEDLQLHTRYKCRIREPWYRVPGIVRGDLLLSKRCHGWPRVIVNDAQSFTTDTIYRGRMVTKDRSARDVAAA